MGSCSGKCKCTCVSKARRYFDSQSKKNKKPPEPKDIKIEEGHADQGEGKVITESMRLNMSETHSDRKPKQFEMKNVSPSQKPAVEKNQNNLGTDSHYPAPKKSEGGMKINQSGILFSEYKKESHYKK